MEFLYWIVINMEENGKNGPLGLKMEFDDNLHPVLKWIDIYGGYQKAMLFNSKNDANLFRKHLNVKTKSISIKVEY